MLEGGGGNTSTEERKISFIPPTITCPVAKLIKDQAKMRNRLCSHASLLLLWHWLGTVDKDRKTRAWACMIVSKAQLLSVC